MRRLALVSLAALLPLLAPASSQAGLGVTPPPAGARVITFDDKSAPGVFGDALALRGDYAPLGVRFSGGTETNGGAVLDESSNFSVVGHSSPNFLAFSANLGATLSDGGKPEFPETITFLKAVKQVQFSVGGPVGGQLTAKAFDKHDNEVDSTTVSLNTQMQSVFLFGSQIVRVVLSSTANLTVIDDLSFLLDLTLIDFDDVAASPFFSESTALRDRYVGKGVSVTAPTLDDGGAVLNAFAFFVSGISSPNALAFNSEQFLASGGTPKFPVFIQFAPTASHVEFLAGTPSSASITATAYDIGGAEIDTATVEIGPNMQKVELDAPGIAMVELDSTGTIAVIDDLAFELEGTIIDFDDADTAPCCFSFTSPLRDRYAPLGVNFLGADDKSGAAILVENGGFGVEGISGPNVLAFNSLLSYNDGGNTGLPETIVFDRPMKRIEFRAGSSFGLSRMDIGVFNATNELVGTSTLYLEPKLQSLWLPGEGITKLEITSVAEYGVIDDLAFTPEDPCAHDPCAYGDALDRACSICVAQVCAENSSCCFDGWVTSCAKSVDTICGQTCDPICGDANDDRRITTTDALIALKTAVGTDTCGLARCDYSGGGSVKSGDALAILKAAVGQPTVPNCPPVK